MAWNPVQPRRHLDNAPVLVYRHYRNHATVGKKISSSALSALRSTWSRSQGTGCGGYGLQSSFLSGKRAFAPASKGTPN
jgi:hypothetical protein